MSLNHLYVVGAPASGKSTLFRALTRDLEVKEEKKPCAHRIYENGVVEIGAVRESFSGTDALAMNGIDFAEELVREQHPQLLIAEGDRLACDRWFKFVQSEGYTLWLFYLETSELKMSDRRLERALVDAKPQDVKWVKGRETKVANLLERWDHYTLEGEKNPSRIVQQMLGVATPFQIAFQGVEVG